MKRDSRIDLLRSVAIVLILLAHVYPPNFLFQIRTFDVPLMAFLMGASYVLSERKSKKEQFHKYLWKRFKRLIIPAWIFLTLYFVLMWVGVLFLNREYPFTTEIIRTSYTLESGINYVWIIRVFFIISILSPVIYFLTQKSNTILKVTGLLLILLAIQIVLCDISGNMIGHTKEIFQSYIAIPFGYCIAAFVGMKASEQGIRKNIQLSLILVFIFILSGLNVNFGQLQMFKYPPSPYFLAYGIGVSLILYTILSNRKIEAGISKFNILTWMSKHSLEIYYWHIFAISVLNQIRPETSWRGKFVIILIGSILVTAIQVYIFPNLLSGKFSLKKYQVETSSTYEDY
ncbi:acyltransferase family protein [Enterococcus quebecensis]|uniref:acyltransferase family protein n=1 Tax=Enterococcus quebecensis TaxID=903983 RepID=UPI0014288E95|nr:acyltransferase [Enterococcus quebecensis]